MFLLVACNLIFRDCFGGRFQHISALILARGGSKGIPLKNLQKVGGHSLLEISLTAIKETKIFASVWVSTDHYLIVEEASKCKYDFILYKF